MLLFETITQIRYDVLLLKRITVEPLLSGHLFGHPGPIKRPRPPFGRPSEGFLLFFTPIKRPPKIKCAWFGFFFYKAMKLAEQLRHFAQFHGHQELALSLAKSNDLIYVLKIRVPKRQTSLQDFFK